MKNAIKRLLTAALILLVFLQFPMPAAATEPPQLTYEDGVTQLREAMVNRQSPITVQVLSDTNADISEALFNDAIAHTGVPNQGDYLHRHLKGLNYSSDMVEQDGQYMITMTYTLNYRTTAQQEAEVDNKVQEILDRLNVYDATDYEKIAAVYNYICKNVSLDVVGSLTGGTTIYTAYGALVQGSAVCQGYASAFYRLALELEVDNRLLSGMVGTVSHGWNIVALDGLYYNVDTTKDAGFPFSGYRHFMKSELPTHTRSSQYDTPQFHNHYPMATADHIHNTHFWDAGVITRKPTGYEEGVKTYTCSVCSGHREERLPKQGWGKENGVWYYYVDGKVATGWKRLGGVWYYFAKSGAMATGWQRVGGVWYHLNASGAMSTGWKKLGCTWYFFESTGAMKTGWKQSGSIWYYLDPSGAMATGWRQVNGTWYYFDPSGAMATGTVKIGSITYRFHSSGAWIE